MKIIINVEEQKALMPIKVNEKNKPRKPSILCSHDKIMSI